MRRLGLLLGKVNNILEKIQLAFGVLVLITFVTAVFLEVMSRYFRGQSFFWNQDVATICFLWSVFGIGGLGFRHDHQLQINLFSLTPGNLSERIHTYFITLLNLAFAIVYTGYGWKALTIGLNRTTSATGWPMEIGWASIFVLGVTSIPYLIERLLMGWPLGVGPKTSGCSEIPEKNH